MGKDEDGRGQDRTDDGPGVCDFGCCLAGGGQLTEECVPFFCSSGFDSAAAWSFVC